MYGGGECYLGWVAITKLEIGCPRCLQRHAGAPWQCFGDEGPLAAGHEVPAHTGGWAPAGQCAGKSGCMHNAGCSLSIGTWSCCGNVCSLLSGSESSFSSMCMSARIWSASQQISPLLQLELRDLRSGSRQNERLRSYDQVEAIRLEQQSYTYLYEEGGAHVGVGGCRSIAVWYARESHGG